MSCTFSVGCWEVCGRHEPQGVPCGRLRILLGTASAACWESPEQRQLPPNGSHGAQCSGTSSGCYLPLREKTEAQGGAPACLRPRDPPRSLRPRSLYRRVSQENCPQRTVAPFRVVKFGTVIFFTCSSYSYVGFCNSCCSRF